MNDTMKKNKTKQNKKTKNKTKQTNKQNKKTKQKNKTKPQNKVTFWHIRDIIREFYTFYKNQDYHFFRVVPYESHLDVAYFFFRN